LNKKITLIVIIFLSINLIIPVISSYSNIPDNNNLRNIYYKYFNNIIFNIKLNNIDKNNLNLEQGDILFRQIENTTITDHSLLYINYSNINETYLFVEAKSYHGFDHVTKKEYTKDELLSGPYKKFARVINSNETQKQNAVDFVLSQIGKPFDHGFFHHDKNHNPTDTKDQNSSKWYCTELVWAAYYNCNHHPNKKIFGNGIDIDNNGWKKDSFGNSMVWPHNILYDDDIKVYYLREKIKIFNIKN